MVVEKRGAISSGLKELIGNLRARVKELEDQRYSLLAQLDREQLRLIDESNEIKDELEVRIGKADVAFAEAFAETNRMKQTALCARAHRILRGEENSQAEVYGCGHGRHGL